MKNIVFIIITLLLFSCNKTKTVLICGDHICVNNAEAEQYFEDNLSLEVKVVDQKKSKDIDLVELNLKSNSKGDRKISLLNKKKTNKKIKVLTDEEIKEKKAQINNRIKNRNTKSKENKKKKQAKLKKKIPKKTQQENILNTKKVVNKPRVEMVDVCTILAKCNIDEISKYLIKQGKTKSFPDINARE